MSSTFEESRQQIDKMSTPAIDFVALLAEARREARIRREKQLQEQQQQLRQQQLRQQHHRQQHQHRKKEGHREEEGQQQGEQDTEEKQNPEKEEEILGQQQTKEQQQGKQHAELQVWKEEQEAQLHEERREQAAESQGRKKEENADKQESRQYADLLEGPSRSGSEDVSFIVLRRVRLRAVDVQHVYNELQQRTVGVGKPFLLIDLQSAAAFASRHVCQAVPGPQLLHDGQLQQQLLQQPPQTLLVYGASHEDDKNFQHLTQACRVVATSPDAQASSSGVAVNTSFPKDTAVASLLQQLLQVLLPKIPAREASSQQQMQQRSEMPASQCLENTDSSRRDVVNTSAVQRKEKLMDVGWLRGGMEAFAVAFPFLCVSSNTEEEAASVLTVNNTMAYLSYPVLVYSTTCGSRENAAAADSITSRVDVSAAAASRASPIENPAVSLNSSCHLSASLEKQARSCSPISPAAASSLAGEDIAASQLPDISSAVHGLYVGTKLHAMSPAIRRRLRIGTVIDLTSAGLPAQLEKSRTRRDRAFSSTGLSRDSKTIHPQFASHEGDGLGRCDRGEEEEKEEDLEQVVRPLASPDTCFAARTFLGYRSSGNDQRSSAAAYPRWLEGMPQRQREVAAAMGKYVLPVNACVELLKCRFGPPRKREGMGEASEDFTPAETEEETGASFCASESREPDVMSNTEDITVDGASPRNAVKKRSTQTESNRVKQRSIALVDMLASSSSGSTRSVFQKKSVLIVHSGDSEKWSGSAAATIVAAFLFAQQKRLQLVLPHQEARMALALLTACWRSAPALEDSHRQQLQRFCETEKKKCIYDRCPAIASEGVYLSEAKADKKNFVASSRDLTELDSFPYQPLSANVSPNTIAAGVDSQPAQVRQSKDSSSCTGGGLVRKTSEKEVQDGSTRGKGQDADDEYLTAAIALHTVTLCGLPPAPVFVVSEEEDVCASVSGDDTMKEEEGEGRKKAETERGFEEEEEKRNDEWPRHLLINLGRITQQTKVLAAASAAGDHNRNENYCCTTENAYRATKASTESEGGSRDQGIRADQTAMAGGSSRSGISRTDGPAKKATSGETAAGKPSGDKSELPGHEVDGGLAFLPAPRGGGGQEGDQLLAKGKKEIYELGALRCFAALCRAESVESRDIEAPAPRACAQVLKTDAAAATKTKQLAGSRLYQLATETQRRYKGNVGVELAVAVPRECIDVCEMWELAANTMGCMVRAWPTFPADQDISGLCEALCALLERLASACSLTVWKASLSTETRMHIFARVTTAWGALLLNISFLWTQIARLLYEDNAPPLESETGRDAHIKADSPSYKMSHGVLGETLLSILLQSIFLLVERLLQLQLTTLDGAVGAPQDRRMLSGAGARPDLDARLAENVSVSPRDYSSSLVTEHTHVTAERFPLQLTGKEEECFFGYPTLGLRLLLCALHGTFLRPQIVPKLKKKLLRAAAVPVHLARPPTDFAPELWTTAVKCKSSLASCASSARAAEAAAAAAVSSVRRILKSDGVQTILYLAEIWAATHPENMQKLLGEALREQETAAQQHERNCHAPRDLKEACLPASLGVVLRPFVFASEEYLEPKR